MAYVIFVITRFSLTDSCLLVQSGLKTLLGGLLLSYIFLRSGDIVPGSVLHISMNPYQLRIGG